MTDLQISIKIDDEDYDEYKQTAVNEKPFTHYFEELGALGLRTNLMAYGNVFLRRLPQFMD